MTTPQEHKDVLRRLSRLEDDISEIWQRVNEQGKIDVEIATQMVALRNEFTSLKGEVLKTVQDHTNRTWALIDKSWKIITFLIVIILLIAGIKIGPELIRGLLGG